MKKAKEDYRGLLLRYKQAKCEIETLNGELTEAYTKVRFLEHEVVQANAKVNEYQQRNLMMSFPLKRALPTKPD